MQIINEDKIKDKRILNNIKELLKEIYKTKISDYVFSIFPNANNGKGGNGIAIKIEDKEKNNKICLKFFYKYNDSKRRKRFINEIEITKKLTPYPNIINIIENNNIRKKKKRFYYYTMPCYEEYDVASIRTFEDRINDLLVIARTIKCIHENEIVHRDIKLNNILLKDNNEPVLIDFGMAKKNNNLGIEEIENDIYIKNELTNENDRIGPYLISPPEFEYRENINMDYRKSDAYLFAKIAWQIILQDKIGFYGEYAKNKNIKYITLDTIRTLYPSENIPSIEPINEMIFECTKDNIVERKNIDDCIFYLMKEKDIVEGKYAEEKKSLNIKNLVIKNYCLTELESKTILINDNTYDDINKMLKECSNVKKVLLISKNNQNEININTINYNLKSGMLSFSTVNGISFIGKSNSIKIFSNFSEVSIEFNKISDIEKSSFSKYDEKIMPGINEYYLDNGNMIKFQL